VLTGVALAESNPVTIRSERMEVFQNKQLVVFTGKVVARKKDFTVYADRLEVYYQSKDSQREVTRMVAKGHVKIVKEKWIARAGKAVYFKDEEKIVLFEDPRVWEGDNVVRGDIITLYLKENRSVVEANPGHKAEAVFFGEQ
jgi:lipopolysaccharide export system protein LptA